MNDSQTHSQTDYSTLVSFIQVLYMMYIVAFGIGPPKKITTEQKNTNSCSMKAGEVNYNFLKMDKKE